MTVRTTGTALGLGAVALAAFALTYAGTAAGTARLIGVAVPVAFGLYRLGRAPADRFAQVLLVAGACYSLTTLAESDSSTLYSVGRVSVWLVEPLLVYLVLAFPRGRLETAGQRRLVAAVCAVAGLLFVPSALLAPFPAPSPWSSCDAACPANAFQLAGAPVAAVDDLVRPLREGLSVVLYAAVAVTVIRRARRADLVLARTLIPAAVVATMRAGVFAVYFPARASGTTSGVVEAAGWLFVMSLPAMTVAFVVGLLIHRLFVADALERLTGTLSSRPSAGELRGALSAALRDPRLEVRFSMGASPSGWVDATGAPAEALTAAPGRTVTEVSARGHVLAAIMHESELLYERALLDGVVAYTATTLQNRELVLQLRSSLAQLTRSRARLVSVADEERRKIERDLHDGAQQRLVALQIKLAVLVDRLGQESDAETAERLHTLEDEISETINEIRRFGHGVYPPLLADRGLSDALHAVARTTAIPTTVDAQIPHRYPREVESAVYFACLEALQNVAKHARGATSVRIAIVGNGRLRFDVRDNGAGFDAATTPDGAGLTNIRDRIGALGGEVAIDSQPGTGTHVTGIVPVP